MLDGIMLLWFAEVVASFVFVAIDISRTPESPVLKWGFGIVTLFTGPIGLVLYLLSCREPLPECTQSTYGLAGAKLSGPACIALPGTVLGLLLRPQFSPHCDYRSG